jgi:hypothetical protein
LLLSTDNSPTAGRKIPNQIIDCGRRKREGDAMDINAYKGIIKETLKQYLERYQTKLSPDEVDILLTTDDEHSIYLILRTGWQDKERVQHILIYIRIVKGRIYVEEDWTDFDVVGHLLAADIPQEDIVLAFHHLAMRRYTGFAPA